MGFQITFNLKQQRVETDFLIIGSNPKYHLHLDDVSVNDTKIAIVFDHVYYLMNLSSSLEKVDVNEVNSNKIFKLEENFIHLEENKNYEIKIGVFLLTLKVKDDTCGIHTTKDILRMLKPKEVVLPSIHSQPNLEANQSSYILEEIILNTNNRKGLNSKLNDLWKSQTWEKSNIKYTEDWEDYQKLIATRSSLKTPSPHPVVNTVTCIGCHSCILACPHDVFTFDEESHVSMVVNPNNCREDTGCQKACPTLPKSCILVNTKENIKTDPTPFRKSSQEGFETNISGIYLVGEVAGMPQIRNAIREGRQTIKHIKNILSQKQSISNEADTVYDVAIVGSGPAGLSATACAVELGLSYITFEKSSNLCATIQEEYPTGKYVQFKPLGKELEGAIQLHGVGDTKEKMLGWWKTEIEKNHLKINLNEQVMDIKQERDLHILTTKNDNGRTTASNLNTYKAYAVVLAMGNSSNYRKLNIEGEDPSRVKYALGDTLNYQQKKIIVFGGGNSAVETAIRLVGVPQEDGKVSFYEETITNEVSLIIRPSDKEKQLNHFSSLENFANNLSFENKQLIHYCIDKGKIKIYNNTEIKKILDKKVLLVSYKSIEQIKERKTTINEKISKIVNTIMSSEAIVEKEIAIKQESIEIENDIIFAMIGNDKPKNFLEKIGIKYII